MSHVWSRVQFLVSTILAASYHRNCSRYTRGLDNVKSYSTPTVLALQKALCSNAALCCLKLEK